MPLHAYDPVRIARPFNCFDHAIGRVGHDAQISSRPKHGLVVRAIDADLVAASHLREARTWVEGDLMMRFRTFVTRPGVLDPRVNFAGDILHQRTAEEDVETLHAVADCEDGLLFGDGMIEQRKIGAFASGVGICGFRIPCGVKERRFYVRGTTG